HYKARFYDPRLGRFLQTDPIGTQDDLNLYAYVGNNPINRRDPTGLFDLVYSAGPLNENNPVITNQNQPGMNYLVSDGHGTNYPMGAGTYQRTVIEGRPFDAVFDQSQTSSIINWGASHISSSRLFGATGSPSMLEIAIQSLPGQSWDTKQYLPWTSVYIINNQAEQRDYVGNAIWGAALNGMGISKDVALLGARVQGFFSGIGREDQRDQQAIQFGYGISSSPFSTSPKTSK
ncbi:RHS repeat-associated core domain-containing protein, partial [Alicycliphilus sp. T452]